MALTQRDQGMIVVCVLAAGLAFAYWNYMWSPRNEELATLQTRIETLTEANEKARLDVARGTAAKMREEADQMGRVLAVMRRLVPVANEVPTLLEQISTAARQTGLDLGEVTPLGVIPGEVFDTHRFKMSVVGPYHRVARFLDTLQPPRYPADRIDNIKAASGASLYNSHCGQCHGAPAPPFKREEIGKLVGTVMPIRAIGGAGRRSRRGSSPAPSSRPS